MIDKAPKESSLVVQGLLGFLSDTGRTELLSSVAHLLDTVVEKTKDAQEIIIVSQIPLTSAEQNQLSRVVSRFLARELPVVNKVDTRLLAGFTLRVGDFFLDASLAQELNNAKHLLLA